MESGIVRHDHGCKATSTITIKGILSLLMESVGENEDSKSVISLGMGDPTLTTCFSTSKVAEEAVADALHSHKFHGYAPTPGLLHARK